MKAKLLLLLCCLFAIEGWANSNDIHLNKFRCLVTIKLQDNYGSRLQVTEKLQECHNPT